MTLKREKPCRCISHHDNFSVASANTLNRNLPYFLNDDPPVFWYQCRCGRFWMKVSFEGYHTNSFTFYAAHVEKAAIENFNISLIDDIFLASVIRKMIDAIAAKSNLLSLNLYWSLR